jgi:hypothetical protein
MAVAPSEQGAWKGGADGSDRGGERGCLGRLIFFVNGDSEQPLQAHRETIYVDLSTLQAMQHSTSRCRGIVEVGKKLRLWSSTRASMRVWRLVDCGAAAQPLKGEVVEETAAPAAFTATIASSSGAAPLGPRTAAVAITSHIIHGGTGPVWWVNKPVFSFTEVLFAAADTRRWHHHTHRVTHTHQTGGKGGSDARQVSIGTESEPRAAKTATGQRSE